jgi:hypothetical protein
MPPEAFEKAAYNNIGGDQGPLSPMMLHMKHDLQPLCFESAWFAF